MATDVEAPVSVGEIVDGKYRIDRVLGAGGMGVVVAATHLTIEQRVAIKFLRPGAHPKAGDYVERFIREARALAKLRSEHVARVYDAGLTEDGAPYIVMELLDGQDLASLLEQTPTPPIADAVEYIMQACEALVEAHEAGIVHRDLKPHNLFLGRTVSGMPLVKVLDFGIAKEIGGGSGEMKVLTDSSVVLGSPLYMAPEQMRGSKDLDRRTDIWSLGVILHQMLAGALPFDAESVPELCVKVLTEAPISLAQVCPRVPPELAAIVARCLQKDPSMRVRSMAELAAALEPYSRSAERGIQDRPWRSMVDTMDSDSAMPRVRAISYDNSASGGVAKLPSYAASTPNPNMANWRSSSAAVSVPLGAAPRTGPSAALRAGYAGEPAAFPSIAPPSLRRQRRKPFFGGVLAGIAAAAAVAGGTFVALRSRNVGTAVPTGDHPLGVAASIETTRAIALSATGAASAPPSAKPTAPSAMLPSAVPTATASVKVVPGAAVRPSASAQPSGGPRTAPTASATPPAAPASGAPTTVRGHNNSPIIPSD